MSIYVKRIRFNKLKEGDVFTFRKNGCIGKHPDDELLRWNTGFTNNWSRKFETFNVLSYGGAAFRIKNTRCFVWTTRDGGE